MLNPTARIILTQKGLTSEDRRDLMRALYQIQQLPEVKF